MKKHIYLFLLVIGIYLVNPAPAFSASSFCSGVFSTDPLAAKTKETVNDLLQATIEISPYEVIREQAQKAIESENRTIIELSNGLSIHGKLSDVTYDAQSDAPTYFQTIGPSELQARKKTLAQQDSLNHLTGYGTAVGAYKSVKVDNQLVAENISPDVITKTNIESWGIREGSQIELVTSGGIQIQGEVLRWYLSPKGQLELLSLQNTTVLNGAKTLFQPGWGRYDLAVSEKINRVVTLNEKVVFPSAYYSKLYKTDVTKIKKSGTQFFNEINERFEKQRARHPERPYGFAFPESKSIVPYMKAELQNRIDLYKGEHGHYWRKKERIARYFYSLLGLKQQLQNQKEALEDEYLALTSLKEEIVDLEKNPNPPYDELIETSYYFTKFMQMTEKNRRSPFRMIPYEYYMNTNYGRPKDELQDYFLDRMNFSGGPKFSTSKGYPKYKLNSDNVFNPDKLEMVVVPVVGFLLASDLVATRNTSVHYATVSGQYARADGFVLAPHTLFLHDIYFHAGLRESYDLEYFQTRKMDEKQIEEFRKQQEVWINAFLKQIKEVPDKEKRMAIAQVMQIVTHDRGKTLAPSTFNNHYMRNYYFIMKGEIWVAGWQQANTRIGANLKEILPQMHDAYKWVLQFWKQFEDSPY